MGKDFCVKSNNQKNIETEIEYLKIKYLNIAKHLTELGAEAIVNLYFTY